MPVQWRSTGKCREWNDSVRVGIAGSVFLAEKCQCNPTESSSVTAGKSISTVWPVTSHQSPHYCFSFGMDHTLISRHQLSPLILPCAQSSTGIIPGIGLKVCTYETRSSSRKDYFINSTLCFPLFTKIFASNGYFNRPSLGSYAFDKSRLIIYEI